MERMEKQTVVEWLFERFIDLNADMKYSVITWEEYLSKRADLLEQSKAMEKEQCLKMLPYDLDELAEKACPDVISSAHSAYKAGFQKAIELLTFKSE